MKMTEKNVVGNRIEFMYTAEFKALPFTFTADTKSGALVEYTDGIGAKYKGICLYDVTIADNPNGAIVVAGIVQTDKLPKKPAAEDKMFPTLIFA